MAVWINVHWIGPSLLIHGFKRGGGDGFLAISAYILSRILSGHQSLSTKAENEGSEGCARDLAAAISPEYAARNHAPANPSYCCILGAFDIATEISGFHGFFLLEFCV